VFASLISDANTISRQRLAPLVKHERPVHIQT
jgi:hypothetical protein